jgi:hypothetical protein
VALGKNRFSSIPGKEVFVFCARYVSEKVSRSLGFCQQYLAAQTALEHGDYRDGVMG